MVRFRMSRRSGGSPGSHSLLRFNWPLMVTQEQDEVIQQALVRGLVKNRKDAYEADRAALP